ncbi:MAG: hypothetical protein IPH13_20615 [Planctomycetes bacterium]|nr:hypothetical protein [Planctomycetota bacterium]
MTMQASVLVPLLSQPTYCPSVVDAQDIECVRQITALIDTLSSSHAATDELQGAQALAVCGYLGARLRRRRVEAAAHADSVYAASSSNVRKSLRELHGGKVTESMVEAELRRDHTFAFASDQLSRVEEVLDIVNMLVKALDRRNRALEHLGFDQRSMKS